MDKSLINEAVDIRRLIYTLGGMATKSCIEDVLMLRHPELTRYLAHDITNHVEFYGLDRFCDRPWRFTRPAPTLLNYPEINQVEIPHLSKRSSNGNS